MKKEFQSKLNKRVKRINEKVNETLQKICDYCGIKILPHNTLKNVEYSNEDSLKKSSQKNTSKETTHLHSLCLQQNIRKTILTDLNKY